MSLTFNNNKKQVLTISVDNRDELDIEKTNKLEFIKQKRTEKFNTNVCIKSEKTNMLQETEKLIQKLKKADETNLINLETTVNNIISINSENIFDTLSTQINNFKTFQLSLKLNKEKAIVFDYTTQPIIAREQKRIFLLHFNITSLPFLRPIVIDGVGLVKAFKNCCSNTKNFTFPIVSIIRCMFYWISKGHSTVLCFPSIFNPINNFSFKATQIQKTTLLMLQRFKLCTIFEAQSEQDNKEWYLKIFQEHRACLITTISQWHLKMPNNLNSDVMTIQKNLNYNRNLYKNYYAKCPERVLQPFFSHDGKLVFFSSFSSEGACVADMIVKSGVNNLSDFKKFDENQLSFLEQAKMLKILYAYLPKISRFRETSVMVEILHRLQPFLP